MCLRRQEHCRQTEQMLIRWVIGFQHSVLNDHAFWRSWSRGYLFFFFLEPHLDLIAYSQVRHRNFCYKYCALMIDIAHGKGTDQAKQMDFQLWSQKAGGKEERRAGWCLVLSEWTNCRRTGGGSANMPPGEPQPLHHLYNQHHRFQQHGLILTGLAGVHAAFMWLLVLHRATLERPHWDFLWLFELRISLICCPSQPQSSSSRPYCPSALSLDVELSAERAEVF